MNVMAKSNASATQRAEAPAALAGPAANADAPSLTFRNRQGELVDVPTVTASRFKNEFGAVLETAALRGAVAITRHDAPKAVLLSFAEFEALTRAHAPDLDRLEAQFDRMLARMQTPRARRAAAEAFDATPAELGRAAVKAARGR